MFRGPQTYELFGIRKNCHSSGKSLLLYFIKGDQTDCNNYRGISLFPNTYLGLRTESCYIICSIQVM
jgi:hypothetical protein